MHRWNISENIAAKIRKEINSAMALFRNVKYMHMAAKRGNTQYELIPTSK